MNQKTSDNVVLAALAVIAAVFALSLGDALIKAFSLSFSLSQLYVLRSVIVLPLLVLLAKLSSQPLAISTALLPWVLLRSGLLALMWFFYYIALRHIPLSVAAAVYYTIPLFITLLAGIALGEKITVLRWFAIFMGFVGVLIIVKPDANGINGYVFLPLLSAMLYACAMVLTRSKCQQAPVMGLALMLNLVFIFIGLLVAGLICWFQPSAHLVAENPFLLGGWDQLTQVTWMVLTGLAIILIVGSVGTAYAYQRAPASLVATFDYAYLVGGIVWGYLFFREVPDAFSVVGICLIVGAGLIVVRSRAG